MERKHTPPYNVCIQAHRNLVHITPKAPECLLQVQFLLLKVGFLVLLSWFSELGRIWAGG